MRPVPAGQPLSALEPSSPPDFWGRGQTSSHSLLPGQTQALIVASQSFLRGPLETSLLGFG